MSDSRPAPTSVRRRRRSRYRTRRIWYGRLRTVLLVLVGVSILVGIYLGFRAFQVRGDLVDVRNDAAALSRAISSGDPEGSAAALSLLQSNSAEAADHTGGPAWRVLEALPLIGDDAHGLREVSVVADGLAREGVVPLVNASAQLSAGSFTPHDHQFPLDVIARLQKPAQESYASFAEADARLDAVDSSGFTPKFATVFEQLSTDLDQATRLLGAADKATQLLPVLLGRDGPRDYLLVLQNNAEIRSSGGLPGTVSLVHADAGRVDITAQITGGGLQQDHSVLPLSRPERQIFGANLGRYFVDANFTPDFPRAAELMQAQWEAKTGQAVDGVFIIDPVTVAQLLRWTGPITVGQVQLRADTAVDVLLHLTYVNVPDQATQNAFFEDVARAAFNVFADGAGSPVDILRSLIAGVDERRVFAWLSDDTQQGVIGSTMISGALPEAASDRPQVGVYLNDGTGAKMQYYLDYDVLVQAADCTGGVQSLYGDLRLISSTPPDIADQPDSVIGIPEVRAGPPGSQVVVANVYGPVGGTFTSLKVADKTVDNPVVFEDHGRPVLTIAVTVDPGSSERASWTVDAGEGQTGDVDVAVTPGVQVGTKSSVAPTAC
ncbi:DUF4012 domain-containing protein [Nocardioides sp.]|uniref:DUF4012 domain-containing protein n=1 Tax=Nocardioides sp. TaxID=35761 RepID=UPI0031FF38CC|nr:hypothetical protein [Nocardioides sp.]